MFGSCRSLPQRRNSRRKAANTKRRAEGNFSLDSKEENVIKRNGSNVVVDLSFVGDAVIFTVDLLKRIYKNRIDTWTGSVSIWNECSSNRQWCTGKTIFDAKIYSFRCVWMLLMLLLLFWLWLLLLFFVFFFWWLSPILFFRFFPLASDEIETRWIWTVIRCLISHSTHEETHLCLFALIRW